MSTPAGARLLLGLDSATEHLALALVEAPGEGDGFGGATVATRSTHLGREHAAHLMGELQALLDEAGADGSRIAGIGVGVGPGSYTGVRIGVATAVALGRAWGVPVSGSSSLLALLTEALPVGERGVALLDARKANVYALEAERLAGPHPRFAPVGEPEKLPRADVLARFPALPLFEGPPDAAALATRALLPGALRPWYL